MDRDIDIQFFIIKDQGRVTSRSIPDVTEIYQLSTEVLYLIESAPEKCMPVSS